MKNSFLIFFIFISILMASGCRRRAVVIREQNPPPLRVEVIPVAPSPRHVWVPGHWRPARRGNYVWVRGHYRR